MGRVGVNSSDIAIITSDNPRTESPMDIIRDIKTGLTEDQKIYTHQILDQNFDFFALLHELLQ